MLFFPLHWVAARFLHWIAVASSGASTANAATQEVLVEAAVKAKWLGCCRILLMCSSKRVAQVCNFSYTPSWQEKTMVADISNLILDFNNISKNGYVPFKLISDHPIIVSLINDASVLWILINY